MYIKLGSSNINYITSGSSDFMIISEVIDSGVSYHRPVLVRTTTELDIWFGKDYKSYNFLRDLLTRGVSLYLYKPVSIEKDTEVDGYVDIDSLKDSNNVYTDPLQLYELPDIPKNGKENGVDYSKSLDTKYRVVSADNFDKYYNDLGYGIKYYIWSELYQEYMEISLLPQNLENCSVSINNRDTLALRNISQGPEYIYPGYTNGQTIYGQEKYKGLNTNLYDENWENSKSERIDLEYDTLAFNLSFDESKNIITGQYILIHYYDKNGIHRKKAVIIQKTGEQLEIPEEISEYEQEKLITNSWENLIEKLIEIYENCGYQVEKLKEKQYLIYSGYIVPLDHFYNISGITVENNIQVTYDIINTVYNDNWKIEFISKTIGTENDEETKIIVKIEQLATEGDYRVIIKKLEYEEVFEGPAIGNIEKEALDGIISKNSKLVDCKIIDRSTNTLPIGNWKLRRAKKEDNTPNMFWEATNNLFNLGDTVYFDYLLIPDVYKYGMTEHKDFSYYPDYKKLLDYSKIIECQVLIQNTKDNYIYNYLDDLDNRLIYFYGNIEIYKNYVPGYYAFLIGLLEDHYATSMRKIVYTSPYDGKELYVDNQLAKKLEKYKSNYLTDNNQIYYYEKYQDGEKYNTTGWMRFCLGKVTRELEKNKWEYLTYMFPGKIRNSITSILDKIVQTFSIIRRIDLIEFELQLENNKLDLSIDTYVSDLVKNNIRMDITINFNKQN